MSAPTRENGSLLLDERDCYWALLEQASTRPSQETLRYAFEPYLPAPLEEVETRFARVQNGTWLACGVDRERLAEFIDAAGGEADSVRPGNAPCCIDDALSDESAACLERTLGGLEFRRGAFESPRAKRWKLVSLGTAAVALVAFTLLLSVGAWKRAQRNENVAVDAGVAARALAASATSSDAASGLDPRLRLTAELRSLERTRDASSSDLLPEDRTTDFVSVLAALPAAVPTSIDSLEVDQEVVTLRGRVRELGDYEALTIALSDLGVWSAPTGSVSRAREGYSFTIALQRRAAP